MTLAGSLMSYGIVCVIQPSMNTSPISMIEVFIDGNSSSVFRHHHFSYKMRISSNDLVD